MTQLRMRAGAALSGADAVGCTEPGVIDDADGRARLRALCYFVSRAALDHYRCWWSIVCRGHVRQCRECAQELPCALSKKGGKGKLFLVILSVDTCPI
jgi:hypothetical protein